MFKKKDKPAMLDLPPEPPKLHDLTGHKPLGSIDEELLPRKIKPHAPHPKPIGEHHDLPPLPDLDDELPPLPELDDDVPDLAPLGGEDHGLKSEDDLKLHDLPPLPKPPGTIKHAAPPPMPLHPAPSKPMPHFPKPMLPPMPPPQHRAHELIPPKPTAFPGGMPKPHSVRPMPKTIERPGPSFGHLFPEETSSNGEEEKIIRDDAAFLSVSAFERVLEDMQVSKADLKHIHQYVSDISGYVGQEDKAYASFREDIVDIQSKLAKIDKVLFA